MMKGTNSRLRIAGQTVMYIVLGAIYCYGVFYWGVYRGGSYAFREWVAPFFHSPDSAKAIADILKIIASVGATGTGALVANYVRERIICRRLITKIRLIEALRNDAISSLTHGRSISRVFLDGECVKYVLNDKDYGALGTFLKPSSALDILRTVAALQRVASLVTDSEVHGAALRIPEYIQVQLDHFDSESALKQLKARQPKFETAVKDTIRKELGSAGHSSE